ncbi:MAG: sulfotransferase [Xenococcaceae cyanobacterium MO_188.B32]|nr:sulfotransferase [Xenococcaceae cyanobacterium MO_188.B32]
MQNEFQQLNKEHLIQEAERRSKVSAKRNTEFEEALEILIDSINREARLNSLGQKLTIANFTRIVTNKLLLDRELENFPTSENDEKKKHLFIIGLPRTGTTLLHNLLALDLNSYYIRLCDGQFPVPASHPDRTEEKIAKSEQIIQKMYELTPSLSKLHYFKPTSIEECSWLFEYQLLDPSFHLRMHVPTYYNWLLAYPRHLESYIKYRDLLVYLGQHYSFNHWILKGPRHLIFLKALLNAFPNAGIIWLHRDPCQAIPSMCSLSHLLRSNYSDVSNPQEIGTIWFEAILKNLRTALDTRLAVGDERFYDLQYSDLMSNPIQEVTKIYSHFGLTFSPEMETAVKSWLTNNPQNKQGKHEYSTQQFGLEVETIRKEFAFYTDYFNIPI